MLEVHAVFRGEVQGVGFRATTRWVADEMGLTGFVKNLPDGSVEVVAQGSEEFLRDFLKKITIRFNVMETSEEFSPIREKYSGFTIQY